MTDPTPGDSALFQPNGLTEVGAGPPMMRPVYVRMGMQAPMQVPGASVVPAVALHGMMSPSGKISDIEILASSDPNLNQTALARAANSHIWASQVQAGATPESYEVYFTMEFSNPLAATR